MRSWEKLIPENEKKIFEKGGFGQKQKLGHKAALLIIDVVESFTGTKPQNVMNAIDEYSTSCGQNAWEALPVIKKILHTARESDMDVIYTKGDPYYKKICGDSVKHGTPEEIYRTHSTPINKEITPANDDFVLEKTKASAFFGTPLLTYLNRKNIDSLFVVGASTSGCVRASVVDAFSYGYPAFVIEDGCFDRSEFFHNASLFDMNAKYATVISMDEAIKMVT